MRLDNFNRFGHWIQKLQVLEYCDHNSVTCHLHNVTPFLTNKGLWSTRTAPISMKLVFQAPICMAELNNWKWLSLHYMNNASGSASGLSLFSWCEMHAKNKHTDTYHTQRSNGEPCNCMKLLIFSHFSFSHVEYSWHTSLFSAKHQVQIYFQPFP